MDTIRFTLGLDFNDDQCAQVVSGARKLLGETGMLCRSEAGRDLLASRPGVEARGERVYVGDSCVDALLADLRLPPDESRADASFSQGSCWCCLNLADVAQGTIRPATEEDLARAVRLYDGTGIHGGPPPVIVPQVAPEHRDLLATRICLENSPTFGGPTGLPTEENLQALWDMYQVVGRHYQPWKVRRRVAEPLAIKVAYSRKRLRVDDTLTARVRVTYRLRRPTFMVIVDLGIPPGFTVLQDSFRALVKLKKIARYSLTGRQITLYLGEMRHDTPLSFSYRLRAKFPIRAKTPRSVAYEYYTPTSRGVQKPELLVVTKK